MKFQGCLKILIVSFLAVFAITFLVWGRSCSKWALDNERQDELERKQAALENDAIGRIKRAEYFYNQELYSQALTEYRQVIESGASLTHFDQVLAILTASISTGDYEFGRKVGRAFLGNLERYPMRDYIRIHTALCCIGVGDRAAAKEITQEGTRIMDTEEWSYTLNAYLNGEISKDKMVSMANEQRSRLTDAYFLIGFEAWANGNASLAKESLSWVARNGVKDYNYKVHDNVGMAGGLLNRLASANVQSNSLLETFISNGGPYAGRVSGYFRGTDFTIYFSSFDRLERKFSGEIHWVKDDKRFQFRGNLVPDEMKFVQSEPGRTGFGPMGSPDLTTFILMLDKDLKTLKGTLEDDGLYLSGPSPVVVSLELSRTD